MAIDAVESSSPSPSSPSLSLSSQQRHFYVAVDRLQYKMMTLLDLLEMARHRPGLPMVVTCSSRDELDSVCSAVPSLPFISLSSLYSDLAEADRASVLEKFRQATIRWNQKVSAETGEDSDTGKDDQKSDIIVVTDACLPLLSSGESPLTAHVLINYELTTKKETYMRRVSTCLASDGFVINMVVGGEVVTLKSLEESINLVMAEMPINIYEIL